MAKIQNSEVISQMINGLWLDPARESVPSELAEKILPVYQVNPDIREKTKTRFSSTTATQTGLALFTSDATKKTYLTGASLNNMSNATADNTSIQLLCTVDGANTTILSLNKLSLTAQSKVVSASFNPPLRIDKNTAVRFANAFTVGASSTSVSVQFIEIDIQ